MAPPAVDPTSIPWYERNIVIQILKIAAFISAITLISTVLRSIFTTNLQELNEKSVKLVLEAVNFIALMSFCLFSIKVPSLNFNDALDSKLKYISSLNVEGNEEIAITTSEKNISRVNLLVKQLNYNIILYALTLLVVYMVFILQGLNIIQENNATAKAIEDIFNYLSSVFLYLAFKVLYNKTLDDNNNKMIYYMDAVFVSIFFILIYAILSNLNKTYATNDLSLISGVFNGLAMGLLFSRFVSMEHVFIGLFEKPANNVIKYRKLFYYGTIFILPLYTLAQPLFGDLKIKEFGNPDIFANLVFFICFIGKFFFLIMFFIYTQKRLIHIYLHLVITKYGIPKNFISFFN